jgi:hypothetical protein
MTADVPRYRERLTVPWWAWLAGVALALFMAAEIHMGYGGVRSWLPYVVLVPLVLASLGWVNRTQIRVQDGELRARDARIPLGLLSGAEALDATAARESLGRELHPLAFVVRVPWVRPMVRVIVADPADPTPYWLVSTRRPEELLAALGLPPAR